MRTLTFTILVYCLTTVSLYAQKFDTLFRSNVNDVLSSANFFEEETVTSVSQTEEALSDVPAVITVITAEQIRNYGFNDLSDLMRILPGFDVTSNARGYGDYFTVRGINGNDRFLVLVNGRKLNPVSGTFLSVGNSIPLNFAKRIEIVYGAASITYGSDAFSCIINIITDEGAEIRDRRTNVRYGLGNFSTHDLSANFKANLNKNFRVNLYGRSYNSQGFSPKPEGAYSMISQYQSPLNNCVEQPKANYFVFAEFFYKNFRFGYTRQHFQEGNSWGLNPRLYVFNKEASWKLNHEVYWLNYKKRFNNGGTFNTDISYNVHQQDPETQFVRFSVLNNPSSSVFRQYMTGRDRSLRLLNTYSQTFFEKIDFIAGVQYDYANIIPAYANDYVFGQPLKYTGNVRQKIEDTITINEQKLGFFSQVRINFSKKINLTAGARYEVSKMFDEAFIPRLALVAKPNQSLTLKAMYAFAFQAPSFFYLYEQFGNVNTIMIPNTKQDFLLNNQKVQTVDFEFAYTKANFYLSGNVFLSKASDLIERRLYTQAVYNPYAGRETPGLRNENIGEQSIHGFMLRSSFRAGKTINFTANYIFTKATFLYGADRAKTLVPRISEHKIYAGIDFFKITGLFNLSAHWQYLPKLNPIASAGKDGKIEGHHFLNFSLATAKYRNIRFFANTQHMLGNKEHVGIFDGGIYMPVIPQAAFRGQIGIEIGL